MFPVPRLGVGTRERPPRQQHLAAKLALDRQPSRPGAFQPTGWADILKERDSRHAYSENLKRRLREVSLQWIATNLKNYRKYLSQEQSVALGGWRQDSGDRFQTLDLLFKAVKTAEADRYPSPRLLLLTPTEEVIPRLQEVRELAETSGIPLILYESPWGTARGDAWIAFRKKVNEWRLQADRERLALGKKAKRKKAGRDWPWGPATGQWTDVIRVSETIWRVRRHGYVYQEDANGCLMEDERGFPKTVAYLNTDGSHDDIEVLRRVVRAATGV